MKNVFRTVLSVQLYMLKCDQQNYTVNSIDDLAVFLIKNADTMLYMVR